MSEKVLEIQRKLERFASSTPAQKQDQNAMELLEVLRDFPMNLSILSTTRIGMTVNKLRKASNDKEVVGMAKTLIRKWKRHLPENDEKGSPTPSNSSRRESASNNNSDSEGNPPPKKVKTEKDGSSLSNKASAPSSGNSALPAVVRSNTPSFPPTSTTDAVRVKCRQLLFTALKGDGNYPDGSNDPEHLAERLEEEIFIEFKHTDMKYKNRVFSRVSNLKDSKNPNLRINFLVGVISANRMAKMTAEEMASDDMRQIRDRFVKEGINDAQLAINQGTKTDLLKCNKCGKRDCTYNQLQTRSSDEPMTTFVLCNACGNRWKFC